MYEEGSAVPHRLGGPVLQVNLTLMAGVDLNSGPLVAELFPQQ